MDTVLSVVLFFAGIGLLWGGTETVLRRVPRLAGALRVSPLLVTALLLAVMTSLPEFCVSLLASLRGQAGAAVSNIVGSNFVTLTFVAGLCALCRPITVGKSIRERESGWMILSAAVLLVLSLDGRLSRVDGLVLLGAYVPYFCGNLAEAKRQREAGTGEAGEGTPAAGRFTFLDGVLFVAGVGMVVYGAELIVSNGGKLALRLGMNETLMGATLFSFGTSLPELAIALGAVLKGQEDVTLGEIYASNIFTGLAVMGALCLVAPLPVAPMIVSRDLPLLVLAGVLMQMFVSTGGRFVRSEALAIIALYGLFLAAQFGNFGISLP
jgi:cation:H+ antiporter